jgi:hypothetical protein
VIEALPVVARRLPFALRSGARQCFMDAQAATNGSTRYGGASQLQAIRKRPLAACNRIFLSPGLQAPVVQLRVRNQMHDGTMRHHETAAR